MIVYYDLSGFIYNNRFIKLSFTPVATHGHFYELLIKKCIPCNFKENLHRPATSTDEGLIVRRRNLIWYIN